MRSRRRFPASRSPQRGQGSGMLHLRPGMNLLLSAPRKVGVGTAVGSVRSCAGVRRTRFAASPQPASSSQPQVTFNRDIAPIIFHSCANCHRPGEAAPFSLLTYADVKKHARQIAEVTRTRNMPPWLPAPQELKFADEMRLPECADRADPEMGRRGCSGRRRRRSAAAAEVRRGLATGHSRFDSHGRKAVGSAPAGNRYLLEFCLSGFPFRRRVG